jgi:hypothetical protein
MPLRELTDLILALLHSVAGPRHHRHGRRGGRCHRCSAPAPAHPPPLPSAPPCSWVLERAPSPSPDWPTYRSMEPSDPNTSPWGPRGRSCAVHGWGPCPNRLHMCTCLHHRVIRGRQREKKKKTKPARSRWSPAW